MNEQLISDLFVEAQRHMKGHGSKEFSEIFAKLIVKECIQVCENEGYRLSMDTKTEHHRDLAKQCHKICVMVEKHFGVEE